MLFQIKSAEGHLVSKEQLDYGYMLVEQAKKKFQTEDIQLCIWTSGHPQYGWIVIMIVKGIEYWINGVNPTSTLSGEHFDIDLFVHTDNEPPVCKCWYYVAIDKDGIDPIHQNPGSSLHLSCVI